MIDIISKFLFDEKIKYLELTGKTSIKERENIVKVFNKMQAIDRIYRIGQEKDVHIYK